MELYIIGYTFGMILFLWLYSLPLKIIAGLYRGVKRFINNNMYK